MPARPLPLVLDHLHLTDDPLLHLIHRSDRHHTTITRGPAKTLDTVLAKNTANARAASFLSTNRKHASDSASARKDSSRTEKEMELSARAASKRSGTRERREREERERAEREERENAEPERW